MCRYENTHSLTLNSARCDSWSSLAQLICCSPVGCQKSGRNATITRSKELRAKCLKYLLITKEPHASGWLEDQDQEFFYNGIWGLKNAGPSAFMLERTMLKSDRIACLYPVVNCVKLWTFWTPLVAALCGSFVISKYLGIWHAALFYFFSFDCFCFTEYIIKLQFTLTLFDSSCCHCDGFTAVTKSAMPLMMWKCNTFECPTDIIYRSLAMTGGKNVPHQLHITTVLGELFHGRNTYLFLNWLAGPSVQIFTSFTPWGSLARTSVVKMTTDVLLCCIWSLTTTWSRNQETDAYKVISVRFQCADWISLLFSSFGSILSSVSFFMHMFCYTGHSWLCIGHKLLLL